MSTFERGTTIRFRLIVKDFDGNIPTQPLPETPTCTVFSDSPTNLMAVLEVVSYETNKFQAYWTIPSSAPIGKTVTLSKMYYAEWSWKWDGKDFVERVPFYVLHVENR